MRIVELFSGIGAQAKALENLNVPHEVLCTCDWDINAIIAYDIIHNGAQDLEIYHAMTIEELNNRISHLSISNDGKKPLSDRGKINLHRNVKERLVAAIDRSHNLVDITKIHSEDLPHEIDLMTYSFPCQDLSLAGNWHGNQGGIDRNANNRSSLLWEVERILNERTNSQSPMPKMLLMENVTAILSDKHKNNFDEWKDNLVDLGYRNQVFTLDARDFGVPQMRKRTYMLSAYVGDDLEMQEEIERMFLNVNENTIYTIYNRDSFTLRDVLKVDYTNPMYQKEALDSNPNDTVSRRSIYENNIHILEHMDEALPTITTKQDRHPNSGVIDFDSHREGKSQFRYLTPRECFELMGFSENDYQSLIDNNFTIKKNNMFFTRDKLNRMAGNSICVNVLESIFEFAYNLLDILE